VKNLLNQPVDAVCRGQNVASVDEGSSTKLTGLAMLQVKVLGLKILF
jgi:hypothetical protein